MMLRTHAQTWKFYTRIARECLSSKRFHEIASNDDHKLEKLLRPKVDSRDLRNKRTFKVANTIRYENTFKPHYAKNTIDKHVLSQH